MTQKRVHHHDSRNLYTTKNQNIISCSHTNTHTHIIVSKTKQADFYKEIIYISKKETIYLFIYLFIYIYYI